MEYTEVQNIAKETIFYARKNIYSGMKLLDIRDLCERKMLELGADSFWYWDIGAFVFAGKFIEDNGYINLDFMGNLGHSIVRSKDDRIY